jgi:integrase
MPSPLRPRHSRRCPTAKDRTAKCKCKPAWRAGVRTKDGWVEKSFATKAAAQSWRAAAVVKLDQGRRITATRQTFREAAEAWLAGAKAEPATVLTRGGRTYKPSALRSIESDLERFWMDDFGGHRLGDIARRDLQAMVDQLIGEGRSSSRVRNVINAGRVIFRHALERDNIQVNPCANLRLPALANAKMPPLEPTVLAAMLDAAPDDLRAFWTTLAYSGLRLGEARALRWSDVTLYEGTGALGGWIAVERSCDEVVGFVAPKSKAGDRRVPVVAELRNVLAEHQRQTGRSGDDFVFGTEADRPFSDDAVSARSWKAWKAANVKRAEAEQDPLPMVRFHAFRRTYGAMLRAAKVVKDDRDDYMGHERPGVDARYTSAIEVEALALENMQRFATFLARVDSSARIEQLDGTAPAPADDLARIIAERLGGDSEALDDLLDRVRAEMLLAQVKAS